MTTRNATKGGAHEELGLPADITAITGGGAVSLLRSGPGVWTGSGVSVALTDDGTCLAVDLSAPRDELVSVTLRWDCAVKGRLLGDHWERSYGDLQWGEVNRDRLMPWYFVVSDGGRTRGFGVRTQCRSFACWTTDGEQLSLTLDTRCGGEGVLLGDRSLRAAEIVVLDGEAGESAFETARRFCAAMCPEPRLPAEPVFGINDWYFAYGVISREVILEHARLLAPAATGHPVRAFCLIDAGWTPKSPGKEDIACWADYYDVAGDAFGDMRRMAADLRALGYRPALWTRPLCASRTDPVSLLLPPIPRVEKYGYPLLDPTIPENLERIKRVIRFYRNWGFEMVKHDFSTVDLFGKWGFQMIADRDITTAGWHFHDRGVTSAEAVLMLYRALREAAGDDLYLLGCNTISHLSAGLFEVNRIGDDTSGREWERTRKMGVNTLGFRTVQHHRFYSADGDCVGLTPAVPWEKNRQWLELVAGSGTPLFVSAQREAVGREQEEALRRCFALAARVLPAGEPLDWMETPFPRRWRLDGRVAEFDWD